ncbi:Hypothetical predicted protein, partial [Lynx pardinus]
MQESPPGDSGDVNGVRRLSAGLNVARSPTLPGTWQGSKTGGCYQHCPSCHRQCRDHQHGPVLSVLRSY